MVGTFERSAAQAIAIRAEVDRERAQVVFGQVPITTLVHLVNSALLVVVLFDASRDPRLLAWLATLWAATSLRLVLWLAWQRLQPHIQAGAWRWLLGHAACVGLAGLLWGSGAVMLPSGLDGFWLLWVFTIGGMCAGAAAMYYAHSPTVLAFLVPACLPVAVDLAVRGRPETTAAGAMILVFVIALGSLGARSSQAFGANVSLRLDLTRQAAELDAANARLEAEVAEHRATEATLRQSQKMEALGQLAGGIAHDVNNVLQEIIGHAALLGRRTEEPETVRRGAQAIVRAVERGSSITRRLLSFARQGELRAEAVPTDRLLLDLTELLGPTLGSGVDVRVEVDPGLEPLLADRAQLETALLNLALNARDAMPGGGVLTLAAAAEEVVADGTHPAGLRRGRYLRLSVGDTGEGMDAATIARAVEPFFTTKPAGKGTGLGLPMAKAFAEQSGGAFAIESEPGRGTRVTLWLAEARDVMEDHGHVPRQSESRRDLA